MPCGQRVIKFYLKIPVQPRCVGTCIPTTPAYVKFKVALPRRGTCLTRITYIRGIHGSKVPSRSMGLLFHSLLLTPVSNHGNPSPPTHQRLKIITAQAAALPHMLGRSQPAFWPTQNDQARSWSQTSGIVLGNTTIPRALRFSQ